MNPSQTLQSPGLVGGERSEIIKLTQRLSAIDKTFHQKAVNTHTFLEPNAGFLPFHIFSQVLNLWRVLSVVLWAQDVDE